MTAVTELQAHALKVRNALLKVERDIGNKPPASLALLHAYLDEGVTLLANYFGTDVVAFAGGIPKDPPPPED